MMRPDAKVEKVYLYPKPVDFRKSIDGLSLYALLRSSCRGLLTVKVYQMKRYYAV